MSLGNIPGISNGDNSPVNASSKAASSNTLTAPVTTTIGGASFNFGPKATAIPWTEIIAAGALVAVVAVIAFSRKKG